MQYSFIRNFLTNGTFLRRDSILAETEFVNRATSDTDPYDQYEFSIKIENVGTCMEKASRQPHGPACLKFSSLDLSITVCLSTPQQINSMEYC